MIKTLYLIFFICTTAAGQRPSFFKEDITFRLDGIFIDVEGYYWFANNSSLPVKSDIYYPFPNYSGEKIDSIRLFNISTGRYTNYLVGDTHGISFSLYINPHDTVIYQIGYRQKVKGDSATYILRTTKLWNKSLEHAEYKLIVPDSIIINKFSYPPDRYYEIQGNKIYYWEMNKFMPERDMTFHF